MSPLPDQVPYFIVPCPLHLSKVGYMSTCPPPCPYGGAANATDLHVKPSVKILNKEHLTVRRPHYVVHRHCLRLFLNTAMKEYNWSDGINYSRSNCL